MGASLPLLARAMTVRIARAGFTIGALYGWNTLGAATGALVATWFLIPSFGLERTVGFGAGINLVCAAAVFVVARLDSEDHDRHEDHEARSKNDVLRDLRDTRDLRGFSFWAVIYAFSGFLALSLEIAWFRLIGVMLKSTAFTFGTMLAVYLFGLAAGSLIGAAIAPRVRHLRAAFLGLQLAGSVAAAVVLIAVSQGAENVAWLRDYFAGYEAIDVRDSVSRLGSGELPSLFLSMYAAVPAVLVMPATMLFGCSFPVLQQLVQTDPARIGRRVGLLLVANIAGSLLGTVLTGFVALDALGTAGTLRALVALSVLFPLLGYWLHRVGETQAQKGVRHGRTSWTAANRIISGANPIGFALVLVVVAGIAWLMPDSATLWSRLHGTTPRRIIAGEDGSGLSVIRSDATDRAVVFVNGIGQSTLPYGDIHTALGAVPAFVHPAPSEALVIGLGSGDTCHAVAGRRELQRIECIEIIRPQLDTLRTLDERLPYAGLTALLTDPRIAHLFGDGRIHLKRGGRQYDIIEADALRPTSSYSGNLYSDGYFELLREHLKPGGLAATWLPSARVLAGFVRVFPYVISVPGVLLGSSQPIAFDRDTIASRLADAPVRDYYRRAGIDIERLMAPYLSEPARYGPDFPRDTLTDYNTDLFPRDEFDLGSR
jgi:spermidine synthase